MVGATVGSAAARLVTVDEYVVCGQEGVQAVAHTAILDTLLVMSAPGPLHTIFAESII
jgi:hypothetical protein